MKLYHGSSAKIEGAIKKSQAKQGAGMDVPADELLNAIYLTPRYDFALAIASMPNGAANIDEKARTIEFQRPELFNPEKEVFVYEFDSENIPDEKLKKVDELQYAVVDVDELALTKEASAHKAREITQFYELKNWKEPSKEIKMEFKMH